MNNIVERAYEINKFEPDFNIDIPNLNIGDVVTLAEVWDGEGGGDIPTHSYTYLVSNNGEDGNDNISVWINYTFKILKEDNENPLNSEIEITDIALL